MFAEAIAAGATELDKAPLGSGRPSLSLKYSQTYRWDMVLRNVFTLSQHVPSAIQLFVFNPLSFLEIVPLSKIFM